MTAAQPNASPPVPARRSGDASTSAVRTVAVIDIGTSSIRVNIAEIDGVGVVRPLDALTQQVSLGQDTFTGGVIERPTLARVIEILKRYRAVMEQYGVTQPEQVRAVATSAVREARNRDSFLDRVYIATGLQVEVIDAAEETRLTYQSIVPYVMRDEALAASPTLVVEIGGGNTEVLMLRGKDVLFSHNYRFGSRRVREMLEKYGLVDARLRRLMERQVEVIVQQVRQTVEMTHAPNIVMLGGEARQAADQFNKEWDMGQLARIPMRQLGTFVDGILELPVEEVVRKYKLLFAEAETLGPTLFAYHQMGRAFKVRHLLVSKATMRDGLLVEMATGGRWSGEFFQQIVRSAMDLGRKYQYDEAHATHVATLCRVIFDMLRPNHRLDPRFGLLLHIAALLHEIGGFVGGQGHHKHSMYLILNSELFGMSSRELQITGLVARYHRRAEPQPEHEVYATMDREGRILVSKLAAILRVADALERAHVQRITNISCAIQDGDFVIGIPDVDDLSLEQVAMHQKGNMFEDVFGLRVVLRKLHPGMTVGAP
jgi:exopolyphosphatase/guanosine-5'-triphosphate,3'-diphosphate pyrophosphatase